MDHGTGALCPTSTASGQVLPQGSDDGCNCAPLRLRSLLAALLLAPGVLRRRGLALRLGLAPVLRRSRLKRAPLPVGQRRLAVALCLRVPRQSTCRSCHVAGRFPPLLQAELELQA